MLVKASIEVKSFHWGSEISEIIAGTGINSNSSVCSLDSLVKWKHFIWVIQNFWGERVVNMTVKRFQTVRNMKGACNALQSCWKSTLPKHFNTSKLSVPSNRCGLVAWDNELNPLRKFKKWDLDLVFFLQWYFGSSIVCSPLVAQVVVEFTGTFWGWTHPCPTTEKIDVFVLTKFLARARACDGAFTSRSQKLKVSAFTRKKK